MWYPVVLLLRGQLTKHANYGLIRPFNLAIGLRVVGRGPFLDDV